MPISQSTYTSLVTAKSASWSSNFYSLSTAKLASTFADYTVSFIQNLSGFSASNVLMATSICADDVCALSASGNIGQFPREALQFLGPFSSSGLAGYPHYVLQVFLPGHRILQMVVLSSFLLHPTSV